MTLYNSHKWVVFVAAVSVAFFDYGIVSSFGGLYVAMLDTFEAGRADTALVQSLLFTCTWGFSVISGLLISRFGIKVGAYCGAVLTSVAFLLSYFATTVYQLYGCLSVIMGAGGATMYVAAVLCVGRSFDGRRKSIAVSVQSIGTAISGFVWPRLFTISLEAYSLRGTFLILGGLFLNNIAFAIVFAATKNINKKSERTKEQISNTARSECVADLSDIKLESDLTNNTNNTVNYYENDIGNIDESPGVGDENNTAVTEQDDEARHDLNISNAELKEKYVMQIKNIADSYKLRSKETQWRNVNKTTRESNPDTSSSYIEANNSDQLQAKTFVNKRDTECINRAAKRCLNPSFHLYMLYTLACILHMSTLAGFLTIYQDLNVSNELSIVESDLTFMTYSLFNVVSRLLPILPAKIRCINSFAISIISSLCGATGQIIFLAASPSLSTTIVAMSFSGISDGGWVSSMQAIILEILPMEKQAVGFGFVLTAMGAVSAGTGPLFGFIRDTSSSYETVLIVTTTTFCVSVLLGCVCLVKSIRLANKT